MVSWHSANHYASVVRELTKLPKETEWVEFKENRFEPDQIGECVSALSNSALLVGKPRAYMVWGIKDQSHQIVGTTVLLHAQKVGNEEFENWLSRLLDPKIHLELIDLEIDGKNICLIDIPAASFRPTKFKGQAHIRSGSYTKSLGNLPEKEKLLWRALDKTPFELGIAFENLSSDEVLRLLDYPAFFELLDAPLPPTSDTILDRLETEKLVVHCDSGQWNITNLGAILFAMRLSDFPSLKRKAVRVIVYRGNGRTDTIREQVGEKGYAKGFEGLIGFINNLLPSNEVIQKALRTQVPMYPEIAVRELAANALIHQDFSVTGAGPMIEIFDNRMEITNPGKALIDTNRFLDNPPQSRNESLASFMRRIGVCEERGSGIDKVVFETEYYQLPAPQFEIVGDSTRSTLFSHRPLTKMDKNDRIRACYLHACLKFVNREYLTNTSVRQRFGIATQNIAAASRLIKEAVDAGKIEPQDPNAAPRLMKYQPFWATKVG